jgi:hypothetical protein
MAVLNVSSDTERSPCFGPPPPKRDDDPRPPELDYFIRAKLAGVLPRAGITTVRDVGSYGGEAIVLRRAIKFGLISALFMMAPGQVCLLSSAPPSTFPCRELDRRRT